MSNRHVFQFGAVGLLVAATGMFASTAGAVPFESVRIGDIDGFGFVLPRAGGGSYTAASGAAADTNGNNLLEAGEFLPDLNTNGNVATGSADDFDNRVGEGSTCTGCTFGGSSAGAEFTDIALSTSYDTSSTAATVFDANTGTTGAGGTFPAGSSGTLTNQPGFIFDFFVADGDITPGDQIFLNVIFGDYDVAPAFVRVTGSVIVDIPLALQGGGEDGLIQAATALLDFSTVFTATTGGFDGLVNVDFLAPDEPYTAFDYVELSLVPLVGVPEPTTILLLGLGLAGLGFRRRNVI